METASALRVTFSRDVVQRSGTTEASSVGLEQTKASINDFRIFHTRRIGPKPAGERSRCVWNGGVGRKVSLGNQRSGNALRVAAGLGNIVSANASTGVLSDARLAPFVFEAQWHATDIAGVLC